MNFTRKWVAGLAFIAASSLFAIETATVGYTTKTLAAGEWAIIGTQFQDIETQTDIKLTDLITGPFVAGTGKTWKNNAPQVQVYENGEFKLYYFASTETGNNWVDDNKSIVDITIPAGSGFWFKYFAECDITISGGVIADVTKTVTTSTGLNLIANPYPADFKLNSDKIIWSGLTAGTGKVWKNNAPQVQVYENGEFKLYYFASTETGNSWVDDNKSIVDITIPAGSGFWFKSNDPVTIEFAE